MKFLTGSRVIGGSHNGEHVGGNQYINSDYDIAVSIDEMAALSTELKHYKWFDVMHSNYNNGLKYVTDHLSTFVLNIIPLHPTEFVAWHHATTTMQDLGITFEDRVLRHLVFEQHVHACKLNICHDIYKLVDLDVWHDKLTHHGLFLDAGATIAMIIKETK